MDIEKQQNEGMTRIGKLIEGARVCMLTTLDSAGRMVSRPMWTLHMDAQGAIRFMTSRSSTKASQLGQVHLAFVNVDDSDYVSITGRAELEFDRAIIDALWTAASEPWFPKGKDDPDLAVLRVDVEQAEYWDATDSRMVHLAAMAVAAVTGKPNKVLTGDHGVVRNGH